MTVVTRQRSDNFAIIPNAVAEDARLSFEARGLLCYLLAKPHNWRVLIADIQAAGEIGRDKAYRLIKELRDTGYIDLDIKRDTSGRIEEQNYIVHDCAVLDRLPFPENPEQAQPLTEKPEVGKPLPENPDAGLAGSGKHGRIYKNPALPRTQSNKTHSPNAFDDGFEQLWNAWPRGRQPDNRALTQSLFRKLPAEIERENAVKHAALWQRIQMLRKIKANMITYLKTRAWRELIDAPDVDNEGRFIIKPAREEWQPWLAQIHGEYGERGVASIKGFGFFLAPSRWPPNYVRQEHFLMAVGQ